VSALYPTGKQAENDMAETGPPTSDFYRETKNQAADATGEAARDASSQAAQATSEAVGEAGRIARDLGSSLADVIKDWVEQQPYAAAAVAFGLGWLYGRTHRPF
jgi:ElaB/YqjD/DUF883 family membrane-anchored ribosome-binding protein